MADIKKMSSAEEDKILKQEETIEVAPSEMSENPKTLDNAENQEPLKISEDSLSGEAAEWKERCLRVTAEYQNYRNRTQKEKDALKKS